MNRLTHAEEGEGVNISPLIDVVFILLIFFATTMAFSDKSAFELKKPEASRAESAPQKSVKIYADASGAIFLGNAKVDIKTLENLLSFKAEKSALIEADSSVDMAGLVGIMDACKSAGIESVYISCKKRGAK